MIVFLAACSIIVPGWRLVGDDPFARQAVVWLANVAMLVVIHLGLRARGQTWEHLGVGFRFAGGAALLRTVLQSVAILVAALAAFVGGSILTAHMGPARASADMSGYEYLFGNPAMLMVALAAVWVGSSFGEEVVYRGFLMTRVAEIGKGTPAAWSAALVVSALVFGLAHFDWGVAGVVQTTFMGLALSGSFLLVRRNLWSLVLAHAYLDTLLLVQLYLAGAAAGGG